MKDTLKKYKEEMLQKANDYCLKHHLYGELNERSRKLMLELAIMDLTNMYLTFNLDDEKVEITIDRIFKKMKEHVEDISKKYVFRVKLKGLEKFVKREIAIPSNYTLEDLGIAIILAFNGDCRHMFEFAINRQVYSLTNANADFYDSILMKDTILYDLELDPKSKINFCYDFGENYEFSIKFVKEVEDIGMQPIEVLKGKGHGIFEDNHYYLDLFYMDPNTLVEDWMDEMQPVHTVIPFDPEEFDVDLCNAIMMDYFHLCKENIKQYYNE